MNEAVLRNYLTDIETPYKTGSATEHTYRPALQGLLGSLASDITALNEPKRIKCGAPDYAILRRTGQGLLTVGYVEAKDISVPLDKIEHGEQMNRYLRALDNLVLTDYLEFRWYVKGEKQMSARLTTLQRGKSLTLDKLGARATEDLLQSFLKHSAETIRNPADLAKRMARLAHMIRDVTVAAFEYNEASDTLNGLYEAFKTVLIPDLPTTQFADMFAQTLAYGLFAARYNHQGPELFNRRDAAGEIPRTNPFLRKLFGTIAASDFEDEPFIGFVNELTQVLGVTDMNAVLAGFGKRTRQEDPIVHFYETFLTQYDPKLRELRGVYYTPEPVVSYIVRSVDHILREQFDCPDGLADTSTVMRTYTDEEGKTQTEHIPRILLLDPACGTGTFLYAIVDQIRESYRKQGNAGMWSSYVREYILPRIFGFELLMAPYAVAHLKLGMQLAALDLPLQERENWAYDFKTDERLGLYLTNTLEEALKRTDLLLGRYITEEAEDASMVKKEYPVMVVIGNPPYAGYSANKGKWIESLMEDYKVTVRKEERQIQRLSNDYVKFFRFAQWRLEKTGEGILSFITDSGYLDGILFRDMRQALLNTFSHIYIFNLHGVGIRGSTKIVGDENVFDITQGVAIGIFIKKKNHCEHAKVHYADIRGKRENKYQILQAQDISNTYWLDIIPRSPHWRFVPEEWDKVYESWPLFTSIIGTGNPQKDRDRRYGTGIKTRHDSFVMGWSVPNAVEQIRRLADRSESDKALIQELGLCTTAHFDIKRARIRAKSSDLTSHVCSIGYRPFDRRYLVYLREFICEPKDEIMSHLMHKDNMAMAVLRRDRKELGTGYFVARGLIAKDLVSNLDDALVWPLYLYPEAQKDTLFDTDISSGTLDGRCANLSPIFITDISSKLNMQFVNDSKGNLQQTFGPEDIFHYIYAIFHSPTYRARYAEFLKIDFPRLPLTSNSDLFRALCNLGEQLVGLHLMEKFGKAMPKYPIKGDNQVEKIEYLEPKDLRAQGQVSINKTQYFDGVPPEVWNFHVGGYQVCHKWLKDRKGRTLSFDDILHYQRIVSVLGETIQIMEQIDETIEEHGGWPLE